MNIEDMNQEQLKNIRKIIEETNKEVFDLKNQNTKQYIFDVLINKDFKIIETICNLVRDKKIKTIAEVQYYVPLLSTALENKKRGITQLSQDGSNNMTTYDCIQDTLYNFNNQTNIKLVIETIAVTLNDDISQIIFNKLLSCSYFWNDLNSINLLKTLASNTYNYRQDLLAANTKKNILTPLKRSLIYRGYCKAVNSYHTYINFLISQYKKIEAENNRNKDIAEVKRLIAEHTK